MADPSLYAAALRQPASLQEQVLENVSGTPMGEAIVRYLRSRNAVPSIESASLGEGVLGDYTRNKNQVRLDPVVTRTLRSSYSTGPQVHELSHAADYELGDQYKDNPNTQFGDAYRKLYLGEQDRPWYASHDPNALSSPEAFAKKLDPKWFRQNQDYRSRTNELVAYGAGNVSGRPVGGPAPLHLDPTLAQEQAILLELALRNKK